MKKIILLFLIFTLLVPSVVLGVTVSPELNPLCWTYKDCKNQRAKLGQPNTKLHESFLQEYPCTGFKGGSIALNNRWGKCLPASVVKTSIAIGGKNVFENAPDFIKTVYNFALGAASILAVIVIMIAGLQWLLSGGNQSIIGASKKRIGGAVVGLFIAYASYFILNTINPAFVNLRLPQVFMVKEQKMMTEFCRDIISDKESLTATVISAYDDTGKKIKYKDLPDFRRLYDIYIERNDVLGNFAPLTDALYCNETYYVNTGGSNTCKGHYCSGENGLEPKGGLCLASQRKSGTNGWEYTCEDSVLGGRVYGNYILPPDCSYFSPEGWVKPFIASDSKLLLVCTDNSVSEVGNIEVEPILDDKTSNVWFVEGLKSKNINSLVKSKCGGADKTRGFILKLYLDEACEGIDEIHLVGGNGSDMGVISRTGWTAVGLVAGFIAGGPLGSYMVGYAAFIYAGSVSELEGSFGDDFFITIPQLKRGYILNLDVANIPDVD